MAKFDVVFEGGGAKGIAFVGALEVLGRLGHQIRRYIGTSAGAITATLCAAGYTPAEMMAAVMEREADGTTPRFSSFMDIPDAGDFSQTVRDNSVTMQVFRDIDVPLMPEAAERRLDLFLMDKMLEHRLYARLFSFTECGGFYSGRTFLEWIQEKLAVKGIAAGDTMEAFARKTGSDLSLVVSDTTGVEMMVLNHRTAPGVPVANAVRMSMSIPFVWQEVVWQASWGTYLGRAKAGNIIVDGGVLSNFPIRLIATTDREIRTIMGDTDPEGAGNLGLMIDENLAVPGAENTRETPLPVTRLRTVQRVSRLIDTMMGASDNEEILNHGKEICRLPAKGYGTLEFGMAGARLEAFLQAARSAMETHLAAVAKAAGA